MTLRQARADLEKLRANVLHRLGLAPAPQVSRRGDEADEATDHEATVLHFATREQLTTTLRAVDAALDRLHAGTYGICLTCDAPIPAPRLRVYPETPRCVRCQLAFEAQHRALARVTRVRIADEPEEPTDDERPPRPPIVHDAPLSELEQTC